MKIFLTGATGFLGAATAEALLREGPADLELHCLARTSLGKTLRKDSRVRVVPGTLQDIGKHQALLQECHYVFHIAAHAAFAANAAVAFLENYEPTRKLVDLLQGNSRLKAFVFTSSIGAVDRAPGDTCTKSLNVSSRPRPRSAYGRSKLRCEDYIRASGLPFVIFRPAWVYGSGMRADSHIAKFVTMVAEGSLATRIRFPGRVSVVHVKDMAKALVKTLGRPDYVGKTYFGATENLRLGEIFSVIREKLQGRNSYSVPAPPLRPLMRRAHRVVPLTVAGLFVDYLCADEQDFLRDFGLSQPVKFSEGIRDVIESHPAIHGVHVITGANSGIGLALARELDRQGRRLVLIDKDTSNLDTFRAHRVMALDLTDSSRLAALAEDLCDARIGALYNNAGVGFRRSLDTISPGEITATVGVNVTAPVLLTKFLLPRLKKDRSHIVNVASSVAYNPLPNMSVYAASKAFLVSWSEALSYELRATNRVYTVSPSGTRTGFQQAAGVKVNAGGRGLCDPAHVAKRIARLAGSKRRVLIMGFSTKLLLIVARLLPREFNVRLWGFLFGHLR